MNRFQRRSGEDYIIGTTSNVLEISDFAGFLVLIDFDFSKKESKVNAYHGGKLDCLY